jgi:hypothetical protein
MREYLTRSKGIQPAEPRLAGRARRRNRAYPSDEAGGVQPEYAANPTWWSLLSRAD